MKQNSPSIERVTSQIAELGISTEVIDLPKSTRTAQKAAEAVGCLVGQIVKSLVFCTRKSRKPILIMTSGSNRVDEKIVADYLGEEIDFASPDFVREQTGFAIGGVSPFGHLQPIETYIDQDLMDYELIWAAAGTPHSVFSIQPEVLVKATEGQIIKVQKAD